MDSSVIAVIEVGLLVFAYQLSSIRLLRPLFHYPSMQNVFTCLHPGQKFCLAFILIRLS